MPYWDGLLLPVGPGRVLLGVEGMRLFAFLLEQYTRLNSSVDRLPPRYELARRRLRAAVEQATAVEGPVGHGGHAHVGHSDTSEGPVPAESETWVGTAEIAKRLQVSSRQAHRYVTRDRRFGEPRWRAGRWEVPALEVTAWLDQELDERNTA